MQYIWITSHLDIAGDLPFGDTERPIKASVRHCILSLKAPDSNSKWNTIIREHHCLPYATNFALSIKASDKKPYHLDLYCIDNT